MYRYTIPLLPVFSDKQLVAQRINRLPVSALKLFYSDSQIQNTPESITHIHTLSTDSHSTQRYVKSVLYYKSSKLAGGWHLSTERNTIMASQKMSHFRKGGGGGDTNNNNNKNPPKKQLYNIHRHGFHSLNQNRSG